ncbi:MAG: YceD family protein [Hylemonella sp.]
MTKEFLADRLDVGAFARADGLLSGELQLSDFSRLLSECAGQAEGRRVSWRAQGSMPSSSGAQAQAWIHLQARVSLPLICQRCLSPVDVDLSVDRNFRFVSSERQAELEDDQAEEDVLVLSTRFDLQALVEDELLMALPLVPRHEVCPIPVKLVTQDDDFDQAQEARPRPFDVLADFKNGKTE